ncbi:MAG: acylphosphatase [Actinomycetota bacterium]
MRRVRVVVSGRVQGVFFRATCARHARALGLGGSVRNMPDGSVEGVFEGPSADVEAMVVWCSTGPELARVDEVEVHEEPITGIRTFG